MNEWAAAANTNQPTNRQHLSYFLVKLQLRCVQYNTRIILDLDVILGYSPCFIMWTKKSKNTENI